MRYIGGKTQLLDNIEKVININTTGSENVFCDIFSGTGSVARYFKPKYEVHSNDFLHFSYVIQKATIENNNAPQFLKLLQKGITEPVKYLEEANIPTPDSKSFFVTNNYAPNDNCSRMYISRENAIRVDFIRNTVESWNKSKLINEIEYYYLLASLIEGVPYVSNITGTYGAFLKEWDKRALKSFEMIRLNVIDNKRANRSYNKDANELIREVEGDILYIDPPYNSRQYAPNYHLLETISRYDNPDIHGVTGMRPYDDIKSSFCVKSEVCEVFEDLIAKAKFSNIIMSYSTDGLMSSKQIEAILKRYGIDSTYKRYNIPYRKYKSKITNKNKTVNEYLFYIRKDIPKSVIFTMPACKLENNFSNITKRSKYLKSPLNYIGGKCKLLQYILPLFPSNINKFIDLFAGGCNVGINVDAKQVICNDLNSKIIDMYNMFKNTSIDDVLGQINNNILKYKLSKENEKGFLKFRNFYNKTGNPIDLYTLACYSYNYQFRFNNNLKFNNPFGRNRSQFSINMKNNLVSFLERIKSIDIRFVSYDFEIVDYSHLSKNDFVYCDPPYFITTGTYNDGNRGFKDWKEPQEIALYNLLDYLHNKNVKFALSNVLTHKGMRNKLLIDWSKKYIVTPIKNNYSNSSYNAKKGESTEVLITNYKAGIV